MCATGCGLWYNSDECIMILNEKRSTLKKNRSFSGRSFDVESFYISFLVQLFSVEKP